ncbi:MAG: mycofactocin-coupled SDR family oxidoreductase [Trebonia sp.]|uniref:mycofactocin-coupled SDR family oxidoreductase n=1 Tax=Trebonia sp. TaxID=2767075 RepID=UPI003BAF6E23
MGVLDGKVALVTGAARGQGRSHARRLAEEGADIIAIDACATPGWLSYPLASEADLAQTVKEVEAAGTGRRIVARRADVRDLGAVRAALDEGVAELGGRLDIVCANAGIISQPVATWEIDLDQWRELIDVTLTGVFVTIKAAVPHMITAGNGGSITLTSSGAALISGGGFADYKAAKSGVLSLTRTLACELAEHFIRVNAICPTAVDTPMIQNETLYRSFRPDLPNPGREDVKAGFQTMNLLPIPWVDVADVSNAIVWLASDAARYITGVTLPVDAGNQHK